MQSIHFDELFALLRQISEEKSLPAPARILAPINGEKIEIAAIRFSDDAALHFLPTPYFPACPPTVVAQWGDGTPRDYITAEWPSEGTIIEKLRAFLDALVAPGDLIRPVWGNHPSVPITENNQVGTTIGLRKFFSGAPILSCGVDAMKERIDSEVVDSLSSSHFVIIGLGSVGSYVAQQLVRSGLGKVSLVDFDTVEASNITRTTYSLMDVKQKKSNALAKQLFSINPSMSIATHDVAIQKITGSSLESLFAESDIIVAATDDPTAQQIINACGSYADKPMVFVALYKGAKGGEISLVVPQLTPCFRCQTGPQRAAAAEAGIDADTDYETGRLHGEVALGADIQHLSSAAIKLIISLSCALKGTVAPISEFTIGAIKKGLHCLTLSMEPDYWFYPSIFGETSGQYAYQGVWLSGSTQQDCSICGASDVRQESPFDRIASEIDTTALRAQILGEND